MAGTLTSVRVVPWLGLILACIPVFIIFQMFDDENVVEFGVIIGASAVVTLAALSIKLIY